ncbi:MAG: endonuclease III [Saprospiraceae bacterium]|nr:endonuclease III [Candidatus Vicinibacter affinis]MBP6172230.1 endonuclease III [Saprospiraceae bacterium]MBK6572070.1 endonuclease III [Candidatus Vicinibacter affinis]MBK6823929.1 endonuclease III [Candidatus Vicinibacter affinis]MBK7305142.1 endonuclease III [Candidatus Vicinibacter affinis]
MTKQEKARFIQDTLDKYFPEVEVPLLHKDPYTLLIAVLLSAQCTDERVNKITPALFALADNPHKMKNVSLDEIQAVIRTCGLSGTKAKNIKTLSKILSEEYNGNVPADIELLEQLPGVGHKTASVVMCQAFDTPAFPVDTHIHRLAWRWGLTNGKNVTQTERDLKSIFQISSWNKLHLQIIYFGRKYCPARGHTRENCPICSLIGRKKM